MKLIKAFIHNIRARDVIQALADAGFRNITLQEVRGALKSLSEAERDYSVESGGLIISETRLSLVTEDHDVDKVTSIIRAVGHIGSGISGYVYVSPVEQVLPIMAPEREPSG
jgi:nitrogen regulatory protein P-II 1